MANTRKREADFGVFGLRFYPKIPRLLEGLDPQFHLLGMTVNRKNARRLFFKLREWCPEEAQNPIMTVRNNESMFLNDEDRGVRAVEGMLLPRDRHFLCHTGDSTKDMTNNLMKTLGFAALLGHSICGKGTLIDE